MKALFLCRGNVGRSTFALYLYRKYISQTGAESAGTRLSGPSCPLTELPLAENVVTVMVEEGIDVSQHCRKLVTKDLLDEADVVVSMAEPETVPDFVKEHHGFIAWEIDDPKGTDLETHRRIKDEIKTKMLEQFR